LKIFKTFDFDLKAFYSNLKNNSKVFGPVHLGSPTNFSLEFFRIVPAIRPLAQLPPGHHGPYQPSQAQGSSLTSGLLGQQRH
jgi:hypothetical protein